MGSFSSITIFISCISDGINLKSKNIKVMATEKKTCSHHCQIDLNEILNSVKVTHQISN